MDYEAQTMDVELAPASSSGQALSVNQAGALVGVPISLDPQLSLSNAYSFAAGDLVVVDFLSQDWAQPRVIGFLNNPVKGRFPYFFWYRVFNWGTLDGLAPVPISDGFVSRLDPLAAVVVPNIWEIGYFKIGWGGNENVDGAGTGDIGMARTVSWSNDDEDDHVNGTYAWLNMRNGGFGDSYNDPHPPQFYPFIEIMGSVGYWDNDYRQWAQGVRVIPPTVASNSASLYLASEWSPKPWGPIEGVYSILTYYCESPYDTACGYAIHGTFEIDLVWKNHSGDQLGSTKLTCNGNTITAQSNDNIYGM